MQYLYKPDILVLAKIYLLMSLKLLTFIIKPYDQQYTYTCILTIFRLCANNKTATSSNLFRHKTAMTGHDIVLTS